MCEFMIAQGFPHEPCTMRPDTTEIFSFPLKSPDGALTYENYSPIKHLDLWLLYQQEWCEHKPSVTVNYTDESILSIGQWVHDNWDMISGISFLPKDDHVYEQAPFEAIDEDTYSDMVESMPSHVDWSGLSLYELEDTSSSSHSLACHGGACEVVDILEN
jgi:ribonucleoside-diphosphate reductase alpha chain